MRSLPDNWLTEGLLDFEYKKYTLLAYLQGVESEFGQLRVYPGLADLARHYDALAAYRAGKQQLAAHFKKEVNGADFANARLTYAPPTPDPAALAELEDVVDYSLPRMAAGVEAGKQLYNTVDDALTLTPLGLQPLAQEQGYVLIHRARRPEVDVFHYRLSWQTRADGTYRALAWRHHLSATHSLTNTFEQIRTNIVRQGTGAAPATYLAECSLDVPLTETLCPVAKRRLVRTVWGESN